MQSPPIPPNEASRLARLHELQLLDSAPEPEYDALVRAAALACGTPISLISLVAEDRQWFKANQGLPEVQGTPRDTAFCAHAINGSAVFEVADATHDPRFADNPLVTGSPDIRFYAGAPLTLENGDAVGTLCVIDREPRQLNAMQRRMLELLAEAAVQMMEKRRLALHQLMRLKRHEAQFAGAPVGLFVTDAQGRLDEANARMLQLWRRPLIALLGDGWLTSVNDAGALRTAWAQSLANGQPLLRRIALRGDELPLRLQLRLQRLDDGRWVGACDLDSSPSNP